MNRCKCVLFKSCDLTHFDVFFPPFFSFWVVPWSSSSGESLWHPSSSSFSSSWWNTSCTVTTTSRRPRHATPMSAHRPTEEGEEVPTSSLCLLPPPLQGRVTAVRVNYMELHSNPLLWKIWLVSRCLTGGGAIKNSQPSSSSEGLGGASLRGTTVVDLNPAHDDDTISQ